MSTVVLTLVVVGGSIAVAAVLAANGELKPATEAPIAHRAPRRTRRRAGRATAAPRDAAIVDQVPARPGLFVRLRAGVALVAMTAGAGAAIALGLVAAITVVSRALESAVQ